MKKLWLEYSAKIDALSKRERALVFAAVVTTVVYIIFALFIDPAAARQRTLEAQMQQHTKDLAALQNEVQALSKQQADPDAARRVRSAELGREISAVDEQLKALQKNLVPAQRVIPLLQEVLARSARLELLALRTLPVSPLVPRAEKPPAAESGAPQKPKVAGANVYKHGVELTLAGSYSDLHDYLAKLERLPVRMFWWRARLSAEEHPRLTMTLTIYTLSLDKAWLEV